jgi:hypothetical protein
MFSTSTSPSKCVTEPAFDAGTSAASPIDEDVRRDRRLQGGVVGGDEPEFVAEAGRVLDVGGAAVQRDHDGEVEVDLAAVEADRACPASPSTSPVLNSVTISTRLSSSSDPSAADAVGFVNAPSSGRHVGDPDVVAHARSVKYQSARNANSSGATGHLIGMSITLITRWPPRSRRAHRPAPSRPPCRRRCAPSRASRAR